MFRSSSLDKTLDVACSHLRLEPDWPSILLICDLIRQNDATPKYAVQQVKKKLLSPNPHTAFYALLVLESIVKNCGAPIHDEVITKENCETFTQLIETTSHENVKTKMLELIQAWAHAFRSVDKYQAIKDTMTILKTKGHTFPEFKDADAMFTSDTAPTWHDGKVCHRCRVEFSFTQRKHHCRNCGQIFCSQCSAKTCTLPKFGIEKEVRVCDGCFAALQKPNANAPLSKRPEDLPAEYLNSSLAQQSQTPVRKSEIELKEEEELQLALALSQSEAEQKQSKPTSIYRAPSKKATETFRDTSPISASSADDRNTDPELAKYLNRDYWEQKGKGISSNDSIKAIEEVVANPTAPSPMIITQTALHTLGDDTEVENFTANLKTQVEIFVNRMKSNSSRGRSISTDSSVQNLFLNLTAFHSRLLEYIKKADDKRMWYEQLQDKLTQIKDSRAALDVLRQEHQEKLRQQAEEQERQRQMQMAYKLELMRKKKQEYLQYQRQLALQRIQEQEREMKMHQDQQKVMYTMGVPPNAMYGPNPQYMPNAGPQQPIQNDTSPVHGMPGRFPAANAPMNNYAPVQHLPVNSNFGQLPGQNVDRFSMGGQPIYTSIGPQLGAQVPSINSMTNLPQTSVATHNYMTGPPPSGQPPQVNQPQPNVDANATAMPQSMAMPPGVNQMYHAPPEQRQHTEPQHQQQQQQPQQYQPDTAPSSAPHTEVKSQVQHESEPAEPQIPEAELISFD